MDFRQIQYFVSLYEEGSVTRASSRLNIVQSALSMQISKLEETMGQPLFVRTPRGMHPTPFARQVYQLFLPLLGDWARATEQVRQTGTALAGHVRVGLIASIAQGILAETLLAFSELHPQVTLSLTDGFTDALCDAVAGGQLDAAIVNKPRRRLTLNSETLIEEDVVLVTGPAHGPLPAKVPLRRVTELRLVLPTRQHGLRGIIESVTQAEGVELAPALEVDSINAIVELVRHGALATLLPRIAVKKELDSGALQGHTVVSPVLRRQVACITHPRRPLSPAATAFIQTLARRAAGEV